MALLEVDRTALNSQWFDADVRPESRSVLPAPAIKTGEGSAQPRRIYNPWMTWAGQA